MPEDRPPRDRGTGLAVGGAVLMVLCCVGHSLALGVGLTGFAAVAGTATGSIAVAAGVVLLGLAVWALVRRRRRNRTCSGTTSRRVF